MLRWTHVQPWQRGLPGLFEPHGPGHPLGSVALPSAGPESLLWEGLQSRLLYKGGACLFEIRMAHVIVPCESFGVQHVCVQTLALPLASCVIFDNLLEVPKSLLLWNGTPEIRTIMHFT